MLQLLVAIVCLLTIGQMDSLRPGEVLVRIETSFGNIDLAIDTTHAPITAENFLKYRGGRKPTLQPPDS